MSPRKSPKIIQDDNIMKLDDLQTISTEYSQRYGRDYVCIDKTIKPILKEDYNKRLIDLIKRRGIFDNSSLKGHVPRYLHSARNIPVGKWLRNGDYDRALEIGTTFLFPLILKDVLEFPKVDFTDFSRKSDEPSEWVALPRDWTKREWLSLKANLEEEPLCVPDETYDLIICFEVIEHLEKDPMFMIAEFNRILKRGGLLFLTTPNSTSNRNVYKILNGHAPHFFMKYSKKSSLYRHNIEYSPYQLSSMIKAGGFEVRRFWTEDLFQDPVPIAEEMIKSVNGTIANRGDNMLVIAEKKTGVIERHPSQIYF